MTSPYRSDRRFGVVSVAAPTKLPRFRISVIVPNVALADDAVRSLTDLLKIAPAREPA